MLIKILDLVLFIGLELFTLAIILRFILQAVQADFYNPISQAVVSITNPVLIPLRRIIPGLGGLDMAALIAALLFTVIKLVLTGSTGSDGYMPILAGALPWGTIIAAASFMLLDQFLTLYFFAFFILVIVSWVAPGSYHPGIALLQQITEPLLAPIRRLVPPVGGLDFSVMVAILIIIILQSIVIPELMAYL